MYKDRSNLLVMLLTAIFILAGGCPGIVPGSRLYRPLPQWEAKFFEQARRDVFPNDFRQHPEAYKDTLVVWTGVITKIEFYNDDTVRVVRLTSEHHYFDWIEDFGIQHERFFLSPRGEGSFAVAWRADTPEDNQFISQFAVGDMLIAYGYPDQIKDNVIGLYPIRNLRPIKPKWYRTDILDYGRPGEPAKTLKTPW